MYQTDKHPAIYFHVGLGKVASTYLQYRFFPRLKGIHYIQRTRFKSSHRIIEKGNSDKYLLSREFDRQLEQKVAEFAQSFPQTRSILFLRRHDAWIASQYRRHIKNGSSRSLQEFLDLTYDQGRWQINDLYFMPRIRALEEHFSCKPLVLFYEDIKKNPFRFFDALAAYMGVDYDSSAISLKPFHTSYNDKQLKLMRKWGSRLFRKERQLPDQPVAKWIKRRSEMLLSYLLLYGAVALPDRMVADEELYPQDYLQAIRHYYQDDWQQCIQYARENNPEYVQAYLEK